jgi:hypothetical protein
MTRKQQIGLAVRALESLPLGAHRHGAVPAPLSRAGRSCQFGRASAPMIPHRVHTVRGPNAGPG